MEKPVRRQRGPLAPRAASTPAECAPAPAPRRDGRGGRPPTGRVQKERGMLRLDDETFAALNAKAASVGKPRADVIRDAITHWCAA